MLVCKLECECVACVYSVMYVLWKEENCKCWCVGRNVCTYVYCMHILRKEENCVCKLECECAACVYSVYVLWKEENCKCWCVSWNVHVCIV